MVADLKTRDELNDLEGVAVDRAIEHERRDEAGEP
jgi:hypothetical protein